MYEQITKKLFENKNYLKKRNINELISSLDISLGTEFH